MISAQQLPRIGRTAMAIDFGRYKKEPKQSVRTTDVKENEALAQIKAAWVKFTWNENNSYENSPERIMLIASKLIKNLDYTAKDVENFSMVLTQFQEEKRFSKKGGLFLSALINNGKDTDYVIHTKSGIRINELGFQNTKNITVEGDIGDFIGLCMKSGRIIVKGNAGGWTGRVMYGGLLVIIGNTEEWAGTDMFGGTLIVKGNTKGFLGSDIENGKIVIEGNVQGLVGCNMKGGEIHLEGEYGELGPKRFGGKIFHQGVLIAEKNR